jgi:hypothetical protein
MDYEEYHLLGNLITILDTIHLSFHLKHGVTETDFSLQIVAF